jgi:hypothetical protein
MLLVIGAIAIFIVGGCCGVLVACLCVTAAKGET